MFNTVLFPINQSREASEAALVVIDIVKKYNSRLTLLSVLDPEANTSPMSSESAIVQLLSQAAEMFAEKGIQANTLEREGKPAFIICDVADEINADLIIMGSRGMDLTHEGATESVTTRVVNLSPCPVLIVP